jgi:ribonuclease P protein subunit POP4
MINSENLAQQEFIGLDTKILDSSNIQLIGLNGTINNETKSMFTLKTPKGVKQVPKSHSVWSFNIDNHEIKINGSKIQKRPHERIGVKV